MDLFHNSLNKYLEYYTYLEMSGAAATTSAAAATSAATTNKNIFNFFSEIDVTQLAHNLNDRRILTDLKTHIHELNMAINEYNMIFNYTKYAQLRMKKIEEYLYSIMKEIENISTKSTKNTAQINSESIQALQRNITRYSQNYANTKARYETTKNIIKSTNVLAKEITVDNIIKVLTQMYDAFRNINKDIIKIDPKILFKNNAANVAAAANAADKKDQFLNNSIAIQLSIQNEIKKFKKLKKDLEEAKKETNKNAVLHRLEDRLDRLKTNGLPIAGLATPEQRNRVGNAIRTIQNKLNRTVRGGQLRKTHKKRKD
jgi:hypothetical protein